MDSTELGRQRILAWFIDALIILGVCALLGRLGWIVSSGYVLLRDGLFEGQSLGKRIMGLKVVAHQAQLPCTFLDSFIRNMLWLLPIVNIVMGFTGLHALVHDRYGRHWGDRLANTQVIRA